MATPSEVTEPRPAAAAEQTPPALPSISAAEAAAAYATGVRPSAEGTSGPESAEPTEAEPAPSPEIEQRATPRRGFLRTLAASVGARFRSASAPAASGGPAAEQAAPSPAIESPAAEDPAAAVIPEPSAPEAPAYGIEAQEPEAPEHTVPEDAAQDVATPQAPPEEAAPAVETSAASEELEDASASPDDPLVPGAVPVAIEPDADADASETEEDAAAEAATEPASAERPAPATGDVIRVSGLTKSFGELVAVDGISLDIPAGSFYGIVGPNGAGKTTTLSMITGLLRPDQGTVHVNGIDVWADPAAAKRTIGVLPDRMRLFDRLTGAQLLYYAGVLRGLDNVTVRSRVKSLTRAFGLEDAVGRLVADYSVGMAKKISLAAALIHSPRVLVLDEPFESVDPVSSASITGILQKYVENGGTVVFSSHGMEFIERVCDHVAIIVGGTVLAEGTVDAVRGRSTLEKTFVRLAGGRKATEDLEWLHSFSD